MSVPDTWHTLGAFRGCDAHDREHGINYTAVTEASGPGFVAAVLAAAEREGIWCALRDEDDCHHEHCYAVLDVRGDDGEIIDDRCIPTREAFAWWVRAIELRPDMSDCPVDTPEAHAVTYAVADLWCAGRHEEAVEMQMGLLAADGAR